MNIEPEFKLAQLKLGKLLRKPLIKAVFAGSIVCKQIPHFTITSFRMTISARRISPSLVTLTHQIKGVDD